ncbi:AMP-dependent synthetase/ligase [Nocardia arizonensis]|uniref:AMP-dependent synthetase/ligase n=1 Tax=Nocardia arizonensis TaxID=1141647 RepID=UPI0006D2BEF5|nr:AMP-binding protein [Nocardia arizonensis]
MPESPALLADGDSLWPAIESVCAAHRDRVALDDLVGDRWETTTYGRLADLVADCAIRLRAADLAHGDRLVIMADTGAAWIVADYAALRLGVVVVPIYPTGSAEQVGQIVAATGATVAVADDPARRAVLAEAGITTFIDPIATDPRPGPIEAAVVARDIATVVFTSGTTGSPKGCVLTHRNVYCATANVAAAVRDIFVPSDGAVPRTVIALPLAHMYGRSTLLATLLAGGTATTIARAGDLVRAMNHRPATFLALTPYLLEKVESALAADAPPDADRLDAAAVEALEYIICGGASMSADHHETFRRRGITILGAYGMTESAAAAAINRPDDNRTGTVGRANPGTSVTVDADGELVITGANVSPGYWGEIDTATVDHGPHSVRTGDLGTIDPHGFIRITGRRKDILITSAGKNVAPAPLEDALRTDPLVAQCVVVGDRRPYIAALIVLDQREVARAALSRAELEAAVQRAVDTANAQVSRAESIRRFRIVPTEFSVASGHLTPSGKLVRSEILADFAADIDTLYG